MILYRSFFVAAAGMLSYGMLSGNAIAEQHCKNVESNVVEISDIFSDPAVCDGYDLCQSAVTKGSINGEWWAFWNFEDEEVVADDTALAFNIDDVFKTKGGDIFGQERGILNFLAPDGYAGHIAISGGTGSYDGVVGWMIGTFVFDAQIGASIGGKLVGEICWISD